MAKSLFEGNIRLVALSTVPADPAAITATELTAGVNLSPAILRSGYRLSATGSDSMNEPSLEDAGNAVTFGSSNYEANITPFRYRDADGASDTTNDVGYSLFTEKGITLWLVERIGPPSKTAFTVGDAYSYFPVITDDPQSPTELSGYEKFVQPCGVQGGVVLRGIVAT